MKISVRLFASLRDATGSGQLTLDAPDGATLREVVAQIVALYPALEGQQALWHFAVNQTHCDADTPLRAGDRVAIFPYVAGG